MPTTRIRQWLLDHPEVLTLAFLLVLKWNEYDLGEITQSGSSAYNGP